MWQGAASFSADIAVQALSCSVVTRVAKCIHLSSYLTASRRQAKARSFRHWPATFNSGLPLVFLR